MVSEIPVWILVLGCGLCTQIGKLAIYSIVQRRFALQVLAQSSGLPSLHSSTLVCLTVLNTIQLGWQATETAICLVFSVIVIHDTMRLRGAMQQQRFFVYSMVQWVPAGGLFQNRVAKYLDPKAHHPWHVVIGGLFGGLFALAFGLPSS